MRIGILGNCQARAWHEATQLLTCEEDVWSIDLADHSQGDPLSKIADLATKTDLLFIVDSCRKQISDSEFYSRIVSEPYIIPSITFSGFHPDTMFARYNDTTLHSGQGSAWLSRIMLWCYLNNVEKQNLFNYYNNELFEKVGYLDHFSDATNTLRDQFLPLDLDPDDWIASCMRLGMFMHGINHPWAAAIGTLAKQLFLSVPNLSIKRDLSPQELHRYMTDYQSNSVWPVYPEIALQLGYEGSYLFKHHGSIQDLGSYATTTWDAWDKLITSKHHLTLLPEFSIEFDNLLKSH